ncbi:MAG: hypothetical protein ABW019_15400 [Chitinophagaceae bacterium]
MAELMDDKNFAGLAPRIEKLLRLLNGLVNYLENPKLSKAATIIQQPHPC